MRRAGVPVAQATAGVVALHGRGGSAADMAGLLEAAGVLSSVAAVLPEAPGQTWWPTSFLAPAAQMEPCVVRGLAAAQDAVATLLTEGMARDRIWLMGFSQGACLALEVFARTGAGLAGVFGFSGGLVGTGDAGGAPEAGLYGHAPKLFAYAGRRAGQVWLSCHARDPHIPLGRVEETTTVLSRLGAEVETLIHPGAGHGVGQADIAALQRHLGR
ncbi:MAG: alpha/beta hydrolase [Gemmobacter sp.]